MGSRGGSWAQRGVGDESERAVREGFGWEFQSLPCVTTQTGVGPVTRTDGSWARGRQGTHRSQLGATGNGQSHLREVTQGEKMVIVGQGVISWGWTDSRHGLGREVDRQEKSMNRTGGQPGRHTDRQTGRQRGRQAVSQTQEKQADI